MPKIIHKTVHLPALPSDWNSLTEKQLREVHKFLKRNQLQEAYKLRVFLLLSGLRILQRTETNPDGTLTYLFRRNGWKYRLRRERLSMQAWEISSIINRYLSFLDEPFQRTATPCHYIRIRGHRFKGPDDLMLNITYQQYGNAQRSLLYAWQCGHEAEELRKEGASAIDIVAKLREAQHARAEFLAHLFTSSSRQLFAQKDGSTHVSLQRVWQYSPEAAERNVRHFLHAPDEFFGMMYQFFQSTQAVFKEKFPLLFTEYTDTDGRDALVMELETVNAVQKYAGYIRQQEVYDTNAVFIFAFLNSMSREAKAIEEMNAKLKRK